MSRRFLVHSIAMLALLCLSSPQRTTRQSETSGSATAQADCSQAHDIELVLAYFRHHRVTLTASEAEELAPVLVAEARSAGMDPSLVLAVIDVESDGNAFAISSAGALGLMQLRPVTARAIAKRSGLLWRGDRTLFDPVANVQLGVRYLSQLRDRFGDLPTALAAYNYGPTRIALRLRREGSFSVGYARRVLGVWHDSGSAVSDHI